jgi:hypothetical protein
LCCVFDAPYYGVGDFTKDLIINPKRLLDVSFITRNVPPSRWWPGAGIAPLHYMTQASLTSS